jgi:hypothetical protein
MSLTTLDKSHARFFTTGISAKALLELLFFVSCAMALRAQTVQIELVNGKTRRPITDSSELNVWVGYNLLVIPTDKQGVAHLRLTHNDNEINVPECDGKNADYEKLANKKPKASKQEWAEFNKKYKCCGSEVKDPIARYADTIRVNTMPGNVSWKVAHQHVGYVPCWIDSHKFKDSWSAVTDFSTEDLLQHGIVTANTCGKATASPQPGHLVLFVRMPSNREGWRQAWD